MPGFIRYTKRIWGLKWTTTRSVCAIMSGSEEVSSVCETAYGLCTSHSPRLDLWDTPNTTSPVPCSPNLTCYLTHLGLHLQMPFSYSLTC